LRIFTVSCSNTCYNVLDIQVELLLGGDESLLIRLRRQNPAISSWKEVAELVGAKREDFDRIRHAARHMQLVYPDKKRRGLL
jgi:hypothetical protein